jgi:hypothetical protein
MQLFTIPAVPASLPEADLTEFCCKNTTVGVAVSLMHLMPQNTSHKHWDNKHIIIKMNPHTVAQDYSHYNFCMIYFEGSST